MVQSSFYTNERDLVTSLALKGKIICNDKESILGELIMIILQKNHIK